MFELMVEDSFNAAHQLKGYEGPCERLHGHTFRVQAVLTGATRNSVGLVVDFKLIGKKLKGIIGELDHTNLNEHRAFRKDNPTSENIAKYIFGKLKKEFAGRVKMSRVTVFESPTASASYYE